MKNITSPVQGRAQTGAGAYGYRTNPATGVRGMHAGIDIACPVGTPIYAPEPGNIIYTGPAGTHTLTRGRTGLCVILRGDITGRDWYFGHCSELLTRPGDYVRAGTRIALSGATGNVTGPHVHLEVRTAGTLITTDPATFLTRRGIRPGDPPPTTEDDDDMKLSDRIELSEFASKNLNNLETLSVQGALSYAAVAGWNMPDLIDAVRENTKALDALRKAVAK